MKLTKIALLLVYSLLVGFDSPDQNITPSPEQSHIITGEITLPPMIKRDFGIVFQNESLKEIMRITGQGMTYSNANALYSGNRTFGQFYPDTITIDYQYIKSYRIGVDAIGKEVFVVEFKPMEDEEGEE